MLVYIIYLLALIICGLAHWQGDHPLRVTAVVLIVSWALTPMVVHLDRHGLNLPVATIDMGVVLIFVGLSMRWRRIWSALLAALMIICVVIRLAAFADPSIRNYSRAASNNIVILLQLAVIAVATWLAARTRRRADEGAVRS